MKFIVAAFIAGSAFGYVVAINSTGNSEEALEQGYSEGHLTAKIAELEVQNETLQIQLNKASLLHTKSGLIDHSVSTAEEVREHLDIQQEQYAADLEPDQQPASIEEELKAIDLHQIVPAIMRLEAQLDLDTDTKNTLQSLLRDKAERDYSAWHESQVGSENRSEARLQDLLENSNQQFKHAVENILSEEQLLAYSEMERQHSEVLVQQKLMHLENALKSLNLEEYQQEEISRLAKGLYQSDKINLGVIGSPYGIGNISMNTDKLEEIKSVLTEAQLQSLML
ncbi:hypothetical protein [Pseudoalteromonas luteoviolacea]|uniref:hypothetical protein n=1 Tax=Pseudoalteromonas luteoviolacea TaxID=43657 RepID=UPI001152E35A|nr:hypothetical protein [Pseudoalteromonas luteoviolacea]TQF67894.1 hypothetical protein FLM44_22205 [Pseudoalteromonas luteoviolacea]